MIPRPSSPRLSEPQRSKPQISDCLKNTVIFFQALPSILLFLLCLLPCSMISKGYLILISICFKAYKP